MPSSSNTPAMYYLDTKDAKKFCEKDKEKLEKQCAPLKNNKDRGKGKPQARLKSKANGNEGHWVMDYCGPLLMQPGKDFSDWHKSFTDINSRMNQIADELKDKVIDKIEEEILRYGTKALGKMAVRRGLTGWIPVLGWVMTAVDIVVTGVEVATKVSEMKERVADLKEMVEALKSESKKVTAAFAEYKNKLKDFPRMSQDERNRAMRELMEEVQTAYATANPCLRARKCTLVPYSKGSADKWLGKGCCPGQTGHHLIPDTMFRDPEKSAQAKEAWKNNPANYKDGKLKDLKRDKLPKMKCWDKYSEGAAPTICAEGANQHAGSHGMIHTLTDRALDLSGSAGKKEMPYSEARDLVLGKISKLYGCDKRCLQEQLDAYYCDKAASKTAPCSGCEHAKVSPNSGKGGPRDGDDDVDNNED